jgi:phage replication O-like protein O
MSDDGWELPNYTQVPNALFEMLAELNEPRLKVLLALFRQTLGYHRGEVALSLNDLAAMTGLHRVTCAKAVKELVAARLVAKEERSSAEYGREANLYTLHFKGTPWLRLTTSPSSRTTRGLVADGYQNVKETKESNSLGKQAGAVTWARRHGLTE